MKRTSNLCALVVAGSLTLLPAALAQQVKTQTTETRITTIEGKVVRYEPGKTIVVLDSGNREVSFPLSAKVVAADDIRVGSVVTLSTEPSEAGKVTVTRITRSFTPEGNIKEERETQSTDASGAQTTVKTTTITGTVSAFESGRSITLVLPDKKTVVYTLDSSSVIPSDVAVGKTYTVEIVPSTSGPVVVKRITTTTTKKTTEIQ